MPTDILPRIPSGVSPSAQIDSQLANVGKVTPFAIHKTMSQDVFSEISDRICKHMNDDHSDAVVLYAQAFGNCPKATAAKMLSIDARGMNLEVETNGASQPVRIGFDRDLVDAKDAHTILVDLMKQARQQLGEGA